MTSTYWTTKTYFWWSKIPTIRLHLNYHVIGPCCSRWWGFSCCTGATLAHWWSRGGSLQCGRLKDDWRSLGWSFGPLLALAHHTELADAELTDPPSRRSVQHAAVIRRHQVLSVHVDNGAVLMPTQSIGWKRKQAVCVWITTTFTVIVYVNM